MRTFFDTSVLVAAMVEEHIHHERSLAAFSAANQSTNSCAAHSLAEVYAILTRYPGSSRLSSEQALLALEEIGRRSTIFSLDGREYVSTLRKIASLGIAGGGVYDGLIAACALKSRAGKLYTWNVSHFQTLWPSVAAMVCTP